MARKAPNKSAKRESTRSSTRPQESARQLALLRGEVQSLRAQLVAAWRVSDLAVDRCSFLEDALCSKAYFFERLLRQIKKLKQGRDADAGSDL